MRCRGVSPTAHFLSNEEYVILFFTFSNTLIIIVLRV